MPDDCFAGFIILYGLIFGSFAKAAIDRLSRGESLGGRSYCPLCQRQLAAKDLIPLVSWLALGGRCRYCGGKIPISYPFVELLTALLLYWCWRIFGLSWLGFSYCLMIILLIIIAGIDLSTMEIPDGLNLALAVSAVPLLLFANNGGILYSLLGAAAAAVPLGLIAAFTGGIGGGDVKLMAAAGLSLGPAKSLLALLLGSLAAAVFAVTMISCRKLTWKSYLPLAPFLAFGIIAAIFYGDFLLSWYKSFF